MAGYSLGHEVLLHRRRNALLTVSHAVFSKLEFWRQIHALREAVWICRQPHSYWDRIERPARFMWRYRLDMRRNKKWARSLAGLTFDDYALAVAEFRNYFNEAHTILPGPEDRAAEVCADAGGYTPRSEMRGRLFGAPLVARLIDFGLQEELAAKLGFKTVFDVPFGAALNLYAVRMESSGGLWIENIEEREEKADYEAKVKVFKARVKAETAHAADTTKSESTSTGLATAVPEELKERPETGDLKPETGDLR